MGTHEWHSNRAKEAKEFECFYEEHDEPGRVAKGWYFRARKGLMGPYATREMAEQDIARLQNTDIWGLKEGKNPTEKN